VVANAVEDLGILLSLQVNLTYYIIFSLVISLSLSVSNAAVMTTCRTTGREKLYLAGGPQHTVSARSVFPYPSAVARVKEIRLSLLTYGLLK
jgi:hypothetical protein